MDLQIVANTDTDVNTRGYLQIPSFNDNGVYFKVVILIIV